MFWSLNNGNGVTRQDNVQKLIPGSVYIDGDQLSGSPVTWRKNQEQCFEEDNLSINVTCYQNYDFI